MITRLMQRQLEEALYKEKTLILYGPRQVGKTTLVKTIQSSRSEKTSYVSCDLPEVQRLLSMPNLESLRRFVGGNRLVVLDEAQRVDGIGIALKILHENFPDTQFLVTGSSSFELGQSVKEPLTGRKREFLLFPVSLAELADTRDHVALREKIPELLRFGTYPEVLTSSDPIATVQGIADDYLFRDILELEKLKSSSLIRVLLEAVALQLGNEVSINELAQLTGCNRATVERYLDLLEKSFIIVRLRALSRNPRQEIAKNRKIYFFDLGVRNALIKNFNELHLRNDVGALWENFCIIERMKFNRYAGRMVNPWFWRTYDQKEIDLVEESGGQFHGFEFKWGSGGKARSSKAFISLYPGSDVNIVDRDTIWDFAGLS